jgi:hypothetical protein
LSTIIWLDAIQWPAMLVTIIAAYYVASSKTGRRRMGFWLYMLGNVMWIVWGLHTKAYALMLLQVCLAVMNIRGERKNATEPPGHDKERSADQSTPVASNQRTV